jgi:hypothetical protein
VLEYLKRIIARLRSSGTAFPPTMPPDDPDAGVRQPRWERRPGGSSSAAVEEPDEQRPLVEAIGRNRNV